MKKRSVFLLALGAFVVGTSELIVGGILKPIADDLQISIALAGQLVTVFSLAFAIGAPVVVAITARMERKKLLIGSLALFIVGCLASYGSSEYSQLMLSRVIVGVSAGVFTIIAFSSVAKLVPPDQIGRAVGTVVLGVSCSMVLGVPLGIAVTKWMNWQVVFAALAIAALIVMLLMLRFLSEIEGDVQIPFKQQFTVLRNPVIVTGLLFSFFFSTSSSAMNSYVTPFMESILHLNVTEIGYMMLVIGIFSVIGSRMGGIWADKWGTVRMMSGGMAILAISLALLPLFVAYVAVGLSLIVVWIFAMSMTIPAIQTYFIQQAPQSSNLVLGLNTSVLHLGVAAGAGIGGLAVDATSTVLNNPWVASGAAAISLVMAIVSASRRRETAI
ncbi:MFS transporter [Cohnella mopanensis]|uniref:MFS transporter n=1 Tax=Cohnella mopanensis TaxID=2911966 RepID=UPI001EF81F4D|nr:MFS transporter [Cohnella mopanensis]